MAEILPAERVLNFKTNSCSVSQLLASHEALREKYLTEAEVVWRRNTALQTEVDRLNRRVDELLAHNNAELERRRAVEKELKSMRRFAIQVGEAWEEAKKIGLDWQIRCGELERDIDAFQDSLSIKLTCGATAEEIFKALEALIKENDSLRAEVRPFRPTVARQCAGIALKATDSDPQFGLGRLSVAKDICREFGIQLESLYESTDSPSERKAEEVKDVRD